MQYHTKSPDLAKRFENLMKTLSTLFCGLWFQKKVTFLKKNLNQTSPCDVVKIKAVKNFRSFRGDYHGTDAST